MLKFIFTIAFIFIFIIFFNVHASESIGYYSNGSLKDSESILERGVRIHKLFLSRKRFYGNVSLVDTLSDTADFIRQELPNSQLMQVGDLANKTGGRCQEHASHQNGLDVDIVYLTKNRNLQSQDAPYWEEDFVKNGIVSKNLDLEKNFTLFKFLIKSHPVSRIFVDEAIKKQFCNFAKKYQHLSDPESIETLRRLRIEKLHSTHFHLRLKCPATDGACVPQAEVPPGTGC